MNTAETNATGKYTNLKLFLITVLRILIGWHFLYEGIIKLVDPTWSAASYLAYSDWVFAGMFHSIAENSTFLSIVDFLNIWGLILIGVALIFGFFTRAAALAGAALLLLYYAANPPFTLPDSMKEGNYMIIDKNLIEAVALVLLAFLPAASVIGWKQIKRGFGKLFCKKGNTADNASTQPDVPRYPCGTPIPQDKLQEQAAPAAGIPATDSKTVQDSSASKDTTTDNEGADMSRRKFLWSLTSIPFVGAFTWAAVKSRAFDEPVKIDGISGATTRTFSFSDIKDLKGELPYAKIKNVELSRMFMGCNLIGGWAHSRDLIYVPELVKKYHTQEKVFETLSLGEQCGMNAIIMNTSLAPLMNAYWKEARNSKMQFISDCAGVGDAERGIDVSVDMGAAACYIQGEITEQILREGGSFEIVGEWLERIRKRGVPAGIGAHSLEVIKRCVDLGLKPDFWVKTLHHTNYWSAKPAEQHDNIWCTNPEETIAYMNNLEEPWIAFKVLAAGAIHPNEGFKYAFEGGADFICVGMYDFQVVDDVNIAARILSEPLNRQRPWRA